MFVANVLRIGCYSQARITGQATEGPSSAKADCKASSKVNRKADCEAA